MRLKWTEILPKGYQEMLKMQKVVDSSGLDHKLLELIKIRASQINGCAHCLDMHTKDAMALGEDAQRIHVLAAWKEAPFYSSKERAALRWCEVLTNISTEGAPEDVYSDLEKEFSNEEIVELTMAIVVINCWNRFAVAFQSTVGDYVSSIKQHQQN